MSTARNPVRGVLWGWEDVKEAEHPSDGSSRRWGSGTVVLIRRGLSVAESPFRSCLFRWFFWMFFRVSERIRKCALTRGIRFSAFVVSPELSESSSVPTP